MNFATADMTRLGSINRLNNLQLSSSIVAGKRSIINLVIGAF
jgi:hypothetical protein